MLAAVGVVAVAVEAGAEAVRVAVVRVVVRVVKETVVAGMELVATAAARA